MVIEEKAVVHRDGSAPRQRICQGHQKQQLAEEPGAKQHKFLSFASKQLLDPTLSVLC